PQAANTLKLTAAKDLQVAEDSDNVTVRAGRSQLRFDKHSARLVSYRVAGVELVKQGLFPNFWRALTDNDYGNKFANETAEFYKQADTAAQVTAVRLRQQAGFAQVQFTLHFPTLHSDGSIVYRIGRDGAVAVDYQANLAKDLPEMPRFGLKMQLPEGFDSVAWYGRGPWENYQDRKESAYLGIYHADVSELYTPYIRPQEMVTAVIPAGWRSVISRALDCASVVPRSLILPHTTTPLPILITRKMARTAIPQT
ncbi:MAG: hypothetical protein LRY40_01750, partial [Shewanella fodinae]|nr:hypothetical protein [Shewanella fodinae]